MARASTAGHVSAWLYLDSDVVLGTGPGESVLGNQIYASLWTGNEVPWVYAFGYRVNLDGNPGRLWQRMEVPFHSLPPNVRHRLARLLRDERARLGATAAQ